MVKRRSTRMTIFALAFTIILGLSGLRETLGDEALLKIDEKWMGDFDGMAERHLIRALVPYSKTFYFLDKGVQRGATYEALKLFEKQVNKQLKKVRKNENNKN